VADIVSGLATSDTILVEYASVVMSAVDLPNQRLADALIHEVGRARGCDRTVTFDPRFARAAGVDLLQ
jgi:predicted nucleic-acid-binding protein